MNKQQRTTNNEQRTNNGFTLIELMVAVGLLAIVLSFAGVIFNASIKTYRTAIANAEIMRKLRAITDQLDSDFQGLCKDAPLMIFFRQEPRSDPNRYDQIMFFADGDFQSAQLYDGVPLVPAPTGVPIRGIVARIYYGQAYSLDRRDHTMKWPFYLEKQDRLLARRQHILSADPRLATWPNPADVNGTFGAIDPVSGRYVNDVTEHDSLSLAKWQVLDTGVYDVSGGNILDICFDFLPWVDVRDARTIHKLMCEGLGSFAVQWAYYDPDYGRFHWFPSDDPDGTGTYSHFDLAKADILPTSPKALPRFPGYTPEFEAFGAFFNIPGAPQINYWGIAPLMRYNPNPISRRFPPGFYPSALKFTFTLFDSKGVIKQGRTFTHIVYLD
jgi:prepilin-type N-terminal cleavage/methylation domain-containing protein